MLQKGEQMLRRAPPLPSSHGGEAGGTGDAVNNLRDDVVSLEKELSPMGAPSNTSFRFMQSSRLPSEQSLLPEHQQDHPAHKDWMHYCIHIRMTLGESQTTSTHLPMHGVVC